MSERTQLTFVWFTGSILKQFFDHMFESIRISEDSLRYVKYRAMPKQSGFILINRVPLPFNKLDP